MIIIRKTGPSEGAIALRNALRSAGHDVRLSTRDSFMVHPRLVINWGDMPDPAMHPGGRLINKRANRNVAANKLAAYAAFTAAGVNVPKHFMSADSVMAWRAEQQAASRPIILARSTATGSGGQGITVVRYNEPVPEALYYTEYKRKIAEYRVHVIAGKAVAVQQKRAMDGRDFSTDARLIRNHENGWVFAVGNLDAYKDQVAAVGVHAAAALGLDLAAVDIIRNSSGDIFVLEANTKPGLESPTVLAAYTSAIAEMIP